MGQMEAEFFSLRGNYLEPRQPSALGQSCASGEDLKLDKLQHFVLDECDKCLDKMDMRKERQGWGHARDVVRGKSIKAKVILVK